MALPELFLDRLELLIDDCNKHLDDDAEGIVITLPIRSEGRTDVKLVHVTSDDKIKRIRAMAYALRDAMYSDPDGKE